MKTIFLCCLALCFAFVRCQKESANSTFKVMLTDAPFDAQEINVDIQEVVARFDSDSSAWVTLPTKAGLYNLLTLQGGAQTLLATGSHPSGILKELRLVLGTANTIKIDNQLFPLTIPSGSESGLKIKINKKLSTSLDSLVIDFDAGLSVVKIGTGDYKLKPVLRVK